MLKVFPFLSTLPLAAILLLGLPTLATPLRIGPTMGSGNKTIIPVELEPNNWGETILQSTPQEQIFRARITRREGRTPVIEAVFNGQQKFELIVDTGANDTVITQQMARALGVVPIGKEKFNTASTRGLELALGRVNSIAIAGATAQDLTVVIAGPELETGLLGHDFFENYDITIKQDVIEFRAR